MAEDRRRVVLVDLDLQYGDVATVVEVTPDHATIVDVVGQDAEEIDLELVQSALVEGPAGIRILACPPRPELAELVELHKDGVHRTLELLRGAFDAVIVDGGRFMGDAGATLMEVADEILVVTTATALALKNTRLTLGLLEMLAVPEHRLRLVLNRPDEHTNFGASEISEMLERRLLAVIPYDSRTVVTAIDAGEPFVLTQPRSGVAVAVRKLAADLMADDIAAGGERRGGVLGMVNR
jgi:pilus assembly protein CpaE